MPIPDFRDFQHSNELYHYGIPRRSGRYPWGSGERPYQSRAVKSIDDVVKKNRNIRKERNRFSAAQETAYQMKYKVSDFEKSVDKLSKTSNIIDKDVKDILPVIRKEIRMASKNQELKKEIYDQVYKHSDNVELSYKDFNSKLRDAVYNIVDSPKYMPEFYKKNSKLSKDIDKYNGDLANEVDRLIGGDIGSIKIPKTKSGVTYNDVINSILEYHTTRNWKQNVMEEKNEEIQELLLSYSLDEYKQSRRK